MFFSLELLILFLFLNMFNRQERLEAKAKVPPQSPLASSVPRASSPLPDEGCQGYATQGWPMKRILCTWRLTWEAR
jgi:hypothetical protein